MTTKRCAERSATLAVYRAEAAAFAFALLPRIDVMSIG